MILLVFFSFDDLDGGSFLEAPLVLSDWEAAETEVRLERDWTNQSNIILLTNLLSTGITLPFFGLNHGCVLDPAGSSSGFSFATLSGSSLSSHSPCPYGFGSIAISLSLTRSLVSSESLKLAKH
jgi:hypothetical protein